MPYIKIRGARVNNLKNIDLDIPRDKLIVITGLSGSGKSSLAFDALYAEGQRRYVESLSAYARQFIDLLDKPDLDLIEGLPPAIAIDQRPIGHNPRSTVGTISEIYDYLRLLYSKIGTPHCPHDHSKLKSDKEKLFCSQCDFKRDLLRPTDFSFNSAVGACPDCGGLGVRLKIDPELIFNHKLTINQGAIKPFTHYNSSNQKAIFDELTRLGGRQNFDLNTPLKDLSQSQIHSILQGDHFFNGIIELLEKRYGETESSFIRQKISQYMQALNCEKCQGQRLKPEILAVKIAELSIFDLGEKDIDSLGKFLKTIQKEKITKTQKLIAEPIIKEISTRLEFIKNVGLNYLSLNRPATTLSGGESQRLRLANQINAGLVGVLYVLDEPSIGLHQRDNEKLIETLRALKDKGNTVIVVEHDAQTMLSADWLIDIGPGAGSYGGQIIFSGTPENIKKDKKSLTGAYLSGRENIAPPSKYRNGNKQFLKILGATEHNLKNIDVEIPLGKLVAITGVSGSGKSTLINDILAKTLNRHFYRAKATPGKYQAITGLELINKVIDIDQSPIGRTPRSNPATYTEVFMPIRDLFANLKDSKVRGYKPNHFSFNTIGGRCEHCSGDGLLRIEMQFLPDLYVKCEECQGRRYKKEILDIKYQGKSIYDVLEMTVINALSFFKEEKAIYTKLQTLQEVGLGYIKLGQSATTLSGGEAQRVKLAAELARPASKHTLYILDEPTTGLHFDDIKKLLVILNRLADKGHTVLVIEHNLDIIKSADWIIDLGPEGGNQGGQIVAQGTPLDIIKVKNSWTGKYLKELI